MVENLEMVFEPLPGEALTRFLSDNIFNINIAKTGVSTWHPIGFFLKNARGEWLGGLTGYIWGGWLHVNFLWVTEFLRGQGHGSRLMDAAEQLAVERGAIQATLETHSFQAEGFYLKRATMFLAVWKITRMGIPNYSCASACVVQIRNEGEALPV